MTQHGGTLQLNRSLVGGSLFVRSDTGAVVIRFGRWELRRLRAALKLAGFTIVEHRRWLASLDTDYGVSRGTQ